jgi:hypothetical protein
MNPSALGIWLRFSVTKERVSQPKARTQTLNRFGPQNARTLNAAAQFVDGRPPGSNRRKTQQPLESSTIVEPVAIVTPLIFSVPFYLLT